MQPLPKSPSWTGACRKHHWNRIFCVSGKACNNKMHFDRNMFRHKGLHFNSCHITPAALSCHIIFPLIALVKFDKRVVSCLLLRYRRRRVCVWNMKLGVITNHAFHFVKGTICKREGGKPGSDINLLWDAYTSSASAGSLLRRRCVLCPVNRAVLLQTLRLNFRLVEAFRCR